MEDKAKLKRLIERFNQGHCSKEELEFLTKLLDSPAGKSELDAYWNEPEDSDPHLLARTSKSRFDQFIRDQGDKKEEKVRVLWSGPVIRTAASIVVLITLASLYFFIAQDKKSSNNKTIASKTISTPIQPGQEKAKIFFEDGHTIDLESLQVGQIVHVGKIRIMKGKDGAISYINANAAKTSGDPIYNKIVTPRAGEYHLILPDGTQVWLNAMTTLRYPISFGTKARTVELDGEAYFKVSKQQLEGKRIPFIVHTGNQQLEVLGTEFNVNSYTKRIQTTLVEGSISLKSKKNSKAPLLLKPNQMAQMNAEGSTLDISEVDPFYIIAWKQGQFAFDNTPLHEVMESIGRWYNVDITYQTDLNGIRFSGTVSRFERLDKLLKFLELSGDVHFNVKERRVIVMK
ncbi:MULTISPECIES: FecR family protein [Sphingobacterium]|jgi:ferric-dicitrate binding protein FerR (iron transport regulator)|uniref:FecR family protein n=1 Tax=Sphingobacterium TaxID=28453 RepID=UPI000E9C65F1|nr:MULTISPECIES: FecR domain-containing protein [Sphingobacterium]HAE66309.1 hypothetical protein [Sphingobacterium sp.]HBI86564.1 hypothetical protein [Sphingobacterium sp.]